MQMLRKSEVARQLGVHRATVERWSSDPRYKHLGFPGAVQLGDNTVAWDKYEIDQWLRKRAAERDLAEAEPDSDFDGVPDRAA